MHNFKLLSQVLRHKLAFVTAILSTLLIGTIIIQLLPEIYVVESHLGLTGGALSWENDDGGNVATKSNRVARKYFATRDQILATAQIKKLLRDFDLISDDMGEEEVLEEIKKFHNAAEFSMIKGDVINPYSGKEGKIETGVMIKYENKSPDLAFKITNELTQNFLLISETTSTSKSKEKVSYLERQLENVGKQILEIDEQIASYKNEHALSTPELHPVLLTRYNELQLRIDQNNKLLSELKRREGEVQADLTTTNNDAFLYAADGSRVLGIDERLTILQIEYADKSSRYSPSHPDIKKLKHEIEVLQKSLKGGNTAGIEVEIAQTKKEIQRLQGRYSNDHPDVVRLKRKQKELQDSLTLASSSKRKSTSQPSNPLYARTLSRLDSVRDEYNETLIDKERLIKEHQDIEQQLGVVPLVQKTLLQFERTREQIASKYAELESAYLQAELTSGLSDTNLYERFELIQPPQFPINPSKPRKNILRLVLLLLSLCAGIVTVLLLDLIFQNIWSKKELQECVEGPVYHIPEFG